MKERPILFSYEMVRAILDGRKTQTRRVIKPQPNNPHSFGISPIWGYGIPRGHEDKKLHDRFCIHATFNVDGERVDRWLPCRYGQPGDLLWVKETWGVYDGIYCCETDLPNYQDKDGTFHKVVHFAGTENYAWGMYGPPRRRPSIFMPRSAARIMLEIKDIRVERVQDISATDAFAEGVRDGYLHQPPDWMDIDRYGELWDKINGEGNFRWDANPWVWVIEFKVINRTSVL